MSRLTPHQVLIEVRAAGLDRGTEHLMTGRPWLVRLAGYGVLRPKQPVPGLDVAGVVAAVGSDVTRFVVGDEVFGLADGSFAEFAAASETKLARKPSSLSFEQAAVSTVGGLNPVRKLRRLLTSSGTLVIVGGENGNRVTGGAGRQLRALMLSPFVGQRLTAFVSAEQGTD